MARRKDVPRFSCMEDCIHLHACRRIQKIGKGLHLNVPRYCTEDCTAYMPKELILAISPDDVMHYIYSNVYMIREGYDEYDVFARSDLEEYEFYCIKCDAEGEES